MMMKALEFTARAVAMTALGLSVLFPFHARAQTFPNRPIMWITTSQPGGITDIAARIIARSLSSTLGQPVVVESRPGAGGIVATEVVAQAKPDGYTILYATSGTIATNPWVYRKLSYDPLKSFAPIHSLTEASPLLVVPAASPFRNVADLVKYAKDNPGKLNFGSAGTGTGHHFAYELFQSAAEFNATHVPYKGSVGALTDLIAGVTDASFEYYAPLKSHLESGKLRALAISSSERVAGLPDVPTLRELGYEKATWSGWGSVVAPAGTPPEALRILADAFEAALRAPDVVQYNESIGLVAMHSMRADVLAEFHRGQSERIKELVARTGLPAQ